MKLKIFFIFLILFYCQSSFQPKGYFYYRKDIDEYFSQAKIGQVIYAKAKLVREGNNDTIIYRQYVFQGANKKFVTFSLREYYGKLKENPDLLENKDFSYQNGQILIEDIQIILGKLSENEIVYKIEKSQKSD